MDASPSGQVSPGQQALLSSSPDMTTSNPTSDLPTTSTSAPSTTLDVADPSRKRDREDEASSEGDHSEYVPDQEDLEGVDTETEPVPANAAPVASMVSQNSPSAAGSNKSASRSATDPVRKRVKSGPQTASDRPLLPKLPATSASLVRARIPKAPDFSSMIYTLRLGTDDQHQLYAHETVLLRSPKFAEIVGKAKGKIRQASLLQLNPHEPRSFEQLISYLYTDDFKVLPAKEPEERIKQYQELMSLAKFYVLPDLQKLVIKKIHSSKVLARIAPNVFFEWAEDMWCEELNHEKGPFTGLFRAVAPYKLRHANPEQKKDILGLVAAGFAQEMFKAAMKAAELSPMPNTKKDEPAVKVEMDGNSDDAGLFVGSETLPPEPFSHLEGQDLTSGMAPEEE